MLRLERMEVQGFKSFYGRTRFDFPGGITAVVGPNGCGKSNICDAISWVLGDQSAKSLRGEKNEDIIFNGSEKRKPFGMAEVSLTLQDRNGDGKAEADPVTIMRRIYRSGESEYWINGVRSRLKDLQDLLESHQIARKVYSVIEQGRVDAVMNAKPKDRRALFEEAAGIAGFKAKKKLAEQKLQEAEGNLARVADVIAVVESQLRSLQRQAAKTRRYQRLTRRIRELRSVVYKQKMGSLERQRQETLRTEEGLREQEIELASRISSLEAEWERANEEVRDQEHLLGEHREKKHRVELEVQREETRCENLGSQISEMRQLNEKETDRREVLRKKRSEVGRNLEEVTCEAQKLEARLVELGGERERAGSELAGIQDRLRFTQAEEESVREQQEIVNQRMGELERSSIRGAEQLRGIRARREETGTALKEAEREEREMDPVCRELSERLETLAGENRELEGKRQRAHEELAELQSRRDGLREELARLERSLQVSEDRSGLLRQVQSEREVASERILGLISPGGNGGDLAAQILGKGVRVAEGFEKAFDAVLGPTAQAVLVADGGQAMQAARTVRAAGESGCRFVWSVRNGKGHSHSTDGISDPTPPVDPRIQFALSEAVQDAGPRGEVVAGLVRRTLVVKDLSAALELHREKPQWNYVTVAGELVRAEGVLEDGTRRVEGIFSLGSQLADLEDERKKVDVRREAVREEIAGLDGRIRETEETIRRFAETREESAKRELAAQWEREGKLEEIAKIRKMRQSFQEQLDRQTAEADRLQEEIDRNAGTWNELELRKNHLKEEAEKIAHRLASHRELLEEIRHRHQAASQTWENLRHRVDASRRDLQKMQREQEDLIVAEEKSASEQRSLQDKVLGMSRELEESRYRSVRLDEQLEEFARLRGELEESLLRIRSGLAEKKEPIRQARKDHQEVQGRLQETEVARARLEAEREHLRLSCREELDCEPEELPDPPETEEDRMEESEREVEELKARVRNLGPVNMVALEELQELEQRHGFLDGQAKDLQESIASLRGTIQRLPNENRQRFAAAFDAIQKEFQFAFEKLFGGGQAQLQLEESEDPLEAGVDIIVQPPGKRLQSIRLLSGGEKALTAIALLFAIFRFRPTPFCVLDEVDAALDEANVARFTRMLHNFTSDTQFILITHSRSTMESADRLYGITMEEPGVSRVLSLRLARDH
ncbi:MAG: chromosome segregation protein SMC [Acidobacteriota bacterium]